MDNESNENRNTNTFTNMEQAACDASMGAEEVQGYDSPCCVHVHSIRNRLADPDGISGKAAIDGIVHAGVLPDDTAKQIKEVSFSQEKAGKRQEKTIITLIWG